MATMDRPASVSGWGDCWEGIYRRGSSCGPAARNPKFRIFAPLRNFVHPACVPKISFRMAVLHNRVSQKELKELLYQEAEPRTTLSFYHYFPIGDTQEFRDRLYAALNEKKVFGRIYI